MGRFSIVEADTDPAAFARALNADGFAERTVHPVYGDFARVYYPVVFGDSLAERSFAVVEGGRPELRIRAEADLSAGEDELRRDVRDSYRSLINWGRRNLSMTYVNADNPDRRHLEDYRRFHARVADGEVHGEAVWATMFDHIAAGGGELSMGFLEGGELVAGTMVMEESDTTLYFSAVYDRERFDKPIGHWPLFDAMIRAKGRGRRHFDFGEVFPRGAASPKEYNIGFFKKGFTSRQVIETVWTVPYGEAGDSDSV